MNSTQIRSIICTRAKLTLKWIANTFSFAYLGRTMQMMTDAKATAPPSAFGIMIKKSLITYV